MRHATGPEAVLRYTVKEVKVATRDGQPRGSVAVQLVRRSGTVQRRTLVVVRDGDVWRVCGDVPV
ncbi:hypothetical protein [Plantactinospora sp. KBS50]|uniref:hypothetical protein n=1 Tax=Plantactinospora sp. KBS50 TaxID=2024580 RepID=UPI003513A1B5